MKQEKNAGKRRSSPILNELKQDWQTLRGLDKKGRIQFVLDYYKWRILTCAFAAFTILSFAHALWQGQKPCRLHVTVVLDTEDNCGAWFCSFAKKLQTDGKPGAVDVNQDQPFDYDNQYYYVQELEVMTTVASGRMDVAVCGKDLYSYLLALNACLSLDTSLSKDLADRLSAQGRLVYDTANLTVDKNGKTDPSDGISGYFAVDLSGTEFEQTYNQSDGGGGSLYAVIISNTENKADCEALLKELCGIS